MPTRSSSTTTRYFEMQQQEHNATPTSQACTTGRRELLQGGLLIVGGFIVESGFAAEPTAPTDYNPVAEFAFTIFAAIQGVINVGETATGQIRAIPITGGEVVGEGIAGRLIPGGADWQRTRPDGVTEIEATYALELTDGTMIKVLNRGLIVPASVPGTPSYFRTAIEFTAPNGPYQWLNEAIFLSSVGAAEGRPGAVQVDVYKLV
jgi:hypothetical protein